MCVWANDSKFQLNCFHMYVCMYVSAFIYSFGAILILFNNFTLCKISLRKLQRTFVWRRDIHLQLSAAAAEQLLKTLQSVSPNFSWKPLPKQPFPQARRQGKGAHSPKLLQSTAVDLFGSRSDFLLLHRTNYMCINTTFCRSVLLSKLWASFSFT